METTHATRQDRPPAGLPRRPVCRASGQFIRAEHLDGNGVGPCPRCKRHVLARPVEALGGAASDWWVIERHHGRPQHLPACRDEDGVLDGCVCGLDAAEEVA
ncbi:MAG TPA: hypothetical protein VKZ72_07910 [Acidimicrobiales bacterium]|nr:hypothetical protein [Acidimicrobiales bacterium]